MIKQDHFSITENAIGAYFNDEALNHISEANADSDKIEAENKFNIFKPYDSGQHFNKTTMDEGSEFLENAQEVVVEDFIEAAKTDDEDLYAQALYDFGRLIHNVQDFYSHTNWINQTGPEVKIWNEDIKNPNVDNPKNLKTTDYTWFSQLLDKINPFFKTYADKNYDSLYMGSARVSHYTMNKDERGSLADILYEKNTGVSGFEVSCADATVHTEKKWLEINQILRNELDYNSYQNLRENLDNFDIADDYYSENLDELRENFEDDMKEKQKN